MEKSLRCQMSLGNTAHSALGIHNAQWLLEGVEMSSVPLVISKGKSKLLAWSLKLAPLYPTDVICLEANSSQLFPGSALSIPTSGPPLAFLLPLETLFPSLLTYSIVFRAPAQGSHPDYCPPQ